MKSYSSSVVVVIIRHPYFHRRSHRQFIPDNLVLKRNSLFGCVLYQTERKKGIHSSLRPLERKIVPFGRWFGTSANVIEEIKGERIRIKLT